MAVSVLVAGLAVLVFGPARWSAQALLLVRPAPGTPATEAAGFYETLGQGQVVATYAELLRRRELAQGAVARTSPGVNVDDVEIDVSVVPDTALLSVQVTADDGSTAEAVADAVAQAGRSYVAALEQPYELTEVGSAAGSGERDSLALSLVAAVVVLAAAAGLAVQQGWHLLTSRTRDRRRIGHDDRRDRPPSFEETGQLGVRTPPSDGSPDEGERPAVSGDRTHHEPQVGRGHDAGHVGSI